MTGASGYLAGELIAQLLENQFRVRGTVRDLKDESKIAHLRELCPVELFEANLLTEGSFAQAFKDVEIVFHLACPHTGENAQSDLVDPAVRGTENVLNEADKAGTVKKVIITSDVATVIGSKKKKPDHVFGERDANTSCSLTENPYAYAKLMQEKTAWEFFKKNNRIRVITILPGNIFGPARSAHNINTENVQFMRRILNGEFQEHGLPFVPYLVSDIRDVALAHVNAALNSHAAGRYIVCGNKKSGNSSHILRILEKKYSQYRLPTVTTGEIPPFITVDNSRAERELWLDFRPLSDTVTDMARSLVELNLVERVYKRARTKANKPTTPRANTDEVQPQTVTPEQNPSPAPVENVSVAPEQPQSNESSIVEQAAAVESPIAESAPSPQEQQPQQAIEPPVIIIEEEKKLPDLEQEQPVETTKLEVPVSEPESQVSVTDTLSDKGQPSATIELPTEESSSTKSDEIQPSVEESKPAEVEQPQSEPQIETPPPEEPKQEAEVSPIAAETEAPAPAAEENKDTVIPQTKEEQEEKPVEEERKPTEEAPSSPVGSDKVEPTTTAAAETEPEPTVVPDSNTSAAQVAAPVPASTSTEAHPRQHNSSEDDDVSCDSDDIEDISDPDE